MLTFGSLFAGIGGLDLGFERAGLSCRWQVEINPFAQQVLQKHWPNVPRWDDVRTFPPDSVDNWRVDLIAGGFPCQDISYAGKGAGLSGERSGLFYEAMRIVRVLAPRYVVLENVSALLTRGLDQVLGTLAALGYDAEWHCIPATAFGFPHVRSRLFIVAYSMRERFDVSADAVTSNPQCLQKTDFSKWQKCLFNTAKGSSGKLWRIPESGISGVVDGIPDQLDRYVGIGNAVVPQVAEFIGRCIVTHATDCEPNDYKKC